MLIKINNLYKSFDSNNILQDINLEIFKGQNLTIIGPSGCGKSTLLKLIIGLIRPDRGSIIIDGEDITRLPKEDMARIRTKFGFVFQGAALFDSLSVYENVAFALRELTNKSDTLIRKIVEEKLEWVGLKRAANLFPPELSGGMKKRVGIARALAIDPELLLYDEPTTGLDPLVSKTIEELIVRLTRELKITALIVTHQISTIFRVSDRIVYLNNGKIEEIGGIPELPEKMKRNEELKNFISAGLVAESCNINYGK